MADLNYCETEARRLDKDRFLCALFAPGEKRAALCALWVFNQEVARIPDRVDETLFGRIRLQWWRDSVVSSDGGSSMAGNPVLESLQDSVTRYGLPVAEIERYFDARERDLENWRPSDLDALEDFCAETSGVLGGLAARILDPDSASPVAVAQRVGTAWALLGIARSTRFHARAGRCYFPQDLCRRFAVDEDRDGLPRPGEPLSAVIKVIVERAATLLADARKARSQVSRASLVAVLPAVLADGYGRRLRRAGYDPFVAAALESPDFGTLVRLRIRATIGRY